MLTTNDIRKGNFSTDGGPFIRIAASSELRVNTLQYSLSGSPWWGHSGGSIETIITGNVKRILKVDWPYVKTIINVEG